MPIHSFPPSEISHWGSSSSLVRRVIVANYRRCSRPDHRPQTHADGFPHGSQHYVVICGTASADGTVRLRAGCPYRVFPPPLDRLSSRQRLVVRRPIWVRRLRVRHVVLVLLPLATQIRYPRPRTRARIRTRACTGGSAIHAAVPAALGWRVLGRTRLGAFGRRCRALGGRIGDVKVVLMVLPIARPVSVVLVRPVVYLIGLIGWVLIRTDRIPVPCPIHLVGRGCALAFLAFFRGALLDHDKALLALALVPLERARDGVEPVGALLVCTHGRERVLGRGDLDVVALLELDAPAPVERGPRRRARVEQHANIQLYRVRQQHWPEGQRM